MFARCEFAAWLHNNWRPLPVLTCGGSKPGVEPMSVTMKRQLLRTGIPGDAVWTEDRSRNTHENAAFGAAILRRQNVKTIVLVVDSQSMLRAESCFRKEGFDVVPAPSTFREFGPLYKELIPGWRAIYRNEATLHETLGLVWYRLNGWL
jgi:uncharacterized SAM-binding protein YcdF (DUF218 family)